MGDNGTGDNKTVKLTAFISEKSAAFMRKYNDRKPGEFVNQLCDAAEYLVSSTDHPFWTYRLSVVDMEELMLSIVHHDCCSCKICLGEFPMINLPTSGPSTQKPSGKRGIPFLSISDLSPTRILTTIIGTRTELSPGVPLTNNDVEVMLEFPVIGQRNWGLRLNNPRLRDICEHYGKDETKWKGKQLLMYSWEDDYNHTTYISCEFPEQVPLPKVETPAQGKLEPNKGAPKK